MCEIHLNIIYSTNYRRHRHFAGGALFIWRSKWHVTTTSGRWQRPMRPKSPGPSVHGPATWTQRPFTGSFYDSSTRREIASMIEDSDQLSGLLTEMDSALAGIPETEPRYQLMVDALADLHAYAEGTYTLFPRPRQDIAVPDARQMSLTDLFEMNVPVDAARLEEPAQEVPEHSSTNQAEIKSSVQPSAEEQAEKEQDETEESNNRQSTPVTADPVENPFAWDPAVKENEVSAPLSTDAAHHGHADPYGSPYLCPFSGRDQPDHRRGTQHRRDQRHPGG